jgi:hypothetical protein
MKRIGIAFLALVTTARAFGQDAPSERQAHSNTGQLAKAAATQPSLTASAKGIEVSEIARHPASDENVYTKTGREQITKPEETIREGAGRDEWMQNDPSDEKQPKEVKKVAKARNQAKPEKLDRRSARGNGNNRPSARRPNGGGRPGGGGRPIHRNR